METCDTCRYGIYPGDRQIQCRRHAPTADGLWPWVSLKDWCGDYEQQLETIAGDATSASAVANLQAKTQ